MIPNRFRNYREFKKVIPDSLLESVSLTDEEQKIKTLCQKSFHAFVRYAWHIMNPSIAFIDGMPLQVICEHLQALYEGHIPNLIINIPPRMGKSTLAAIAFPAWVWTKSPGYRFLYTAYAQSLSVRDSSACRRLLLSPWYQNLWGRKFSLLHDSNTKLRFHNNKGGFRLCSSVGGSNTGEGGDIIIADDPNNVSDSTSELIREGTNEWWSSVMSTRVTNLSTARRLVIQQRCHSRDLSGYILSSYADDWVHLNLPMEFEKHRRCKTIVLPSSSPRIWRDPRRKEGDLLWPELMGPKEVEKLKRFFKHDTYRISGQLQQRPAPEGGGIIKTDWFQPFTESEYPEFIYILQSWDTALTKKDSSAYSACTTWGVWEDQKNGHRNIMLLSLFAERLEYPELRKMAVRLSNNYFDTDQEEPLKYKVAPHLVVIEEKVSGYSLIQDLSRANIPISAFKPNKYGDKVARARKTTHLMENGRIFLPTEHPDYTEYTQEAQRFLEACSLFPNGESNDIIDSMSQALIRISEGDWVFNTDDDYVPYEHMRHQYKKKKYY